MPDLVSTIKKALAGTAKSSLLRGRLISTSGFAAQVDVSGSRIPAFVLGEAMPDIGDDVWVLFVGTTGLVLGSVNVKPPTGTVAAAPDSGFVLVTTALGDISMRYDNALSLSIGQTVQLGAWNGDPFVFAVSSATPAPPAPPDPPEAPDPAGPTAHSETFTATATGSWWTSSGGVQNSSVYDSASMVGAWFYGSVIADTIPDDATITDVAIYLSAIQVAFGNPILGTHANAAPPGSAPAVSNLVTAPGNSGWVPLPTSIGDFLKGNVGGIGTAHGGYNIYRSRSADGQSGALKIGWIS